MTCVLRSVTDMIGLCLNVDTHRYADNQLVAMRLGNVHGILRPCTLRMIPTCLLSLFVW